MVNAPLFAALDISRVTTMQILKKLDQETLDTTFKNICWDDTDLVTYDIYEGRRVTFPEDISGKYNYHALYRTCCVPKEYLEIVFVGCESLPIAYFGDVYINGIVKGDVTELLDCKGELNLRCQCILYKFLDMPFEEARDFFKFYEAKSYPNTDEIYEEGYVLLDVVSKENVSVVLIPHNEAVEVTISDKNNGTCSAKLSKEEVEKLIPHLLSVVKKNV